MKLLYLHFLLISTILYNGIDFVSGEITFGSCPNKCSCGTDMDGKLIIDCTGAEYDYVPVTAIPCGTKKLIFKNNELQ